MHTKSTASTTPPKNRLKRTRRMTLSQKRRLHNLDAKTIEAMITNHNRIMGLIYEAMDLDIDRERDYYAEEQALEDRSYKHDRY